MLRDLVDPEAVLKHSPGRTIVKAGGCGDAAGLENRRAWRLDSAWEVDRIVRWVNVAAGKIVGVRARKLVRVCGSSGVQALHSQPPNGAGMWRNR